MEVSFIWKLLVHYGLMVIYHQMVWDQMTKMNTRKITLLCMTWVLVQEGQFRFMLAFLRVQEILKQMGRMEKVMVDMVAGEEF